MNPAESIVFFARFGLLKTKIKNWKSRPDLEGRAQAHAPEKSFAVGMKWLISDKSSLSIDVVGKSSFYYSDSHNNKSKSYQLANLLIGYSNEKLSADIWVRNLFDEYYSTRGFFFGNEAPNFEDKLYRRQGDPKNIGFSLRYNF